MLKTLKWPTLQERRNISRLSLLQSPQNYSPAHTATIMFPNKTVPD